MVSIRGRVSIMCLALLALLAVSCSIANQAGGDGPPAIPQDEVSAAMQPEPLAAAHGESGNLVRLERAHGLEPLHADSGLAVGDNTLFLLNNVAYAPEPFVSDLILSDIAGTSGILGLARADLGEFSDIKVGIGLGDPKHMLHLFNGPLTPAGFTPRPVRMAFTNAVTGKAVTDGLQIGIDIDGNADIGQQENLPLSLSTNGITRLLVTPSGNVGIGTTHPGHSLSVGGTIESKTGGFMFPDGTVQTTAAGGVGTTIPAGGIIMWSGSLGNIPVGWALCDGSQGTPDLRDRFIVGSGLSYGTGQTGGSTTHDHLFPGVGPPGITIDDNSGGTDYHHVVEEDLPPFYALAYIMKF